MKPPAEGPAAPAAFNGKTGCRAPGPIAHTQLCQAQESLGSGSKVGVATSRQQARAGQGGYPHLGQCLWKRAYGTCHQPLSRGHSQGQDPLPQEASVSTAAESHIQPGRPRAQRGAPTYRMP